MSWLTVEPFEEIAVEWHTIDRQKVIVEKLMRQSSGGSNRLLGFN
jgi:hypothetical protein